MRFWTPRRGVTETDNSVEVFWLSPLAFSNNSGAHPCLPLLLPPQLRPDPATTEAVHTGSRSGPGLRALVALGEQSTDTDVMWAQSASLTIAAALCVAAAAACPP